MLSLIIMAIVLAFIGLIVRDFVLNLFTLYQYDRVNLTEWKKSDLHPEDITYCVWKGLYPQWIIQFQRGTAHGEVSYVKKRHDRIPQTKDELIVLPADQEVLHEWQTSSWFDPEEQMSYQIKGPKLNLWNASLQLLRLAFCFCGFYLAATWQGNRVDWSFFGILGEVLIFFVIAVLCIQSTPWKLYAKS